jgi:twitching motility protein PilJ
MWERREPRSFLRASPAEHTGRIDAAGDRRPCPRAAAHVPMLPDDVDAMEQGMGTVAMGSGAASLQLRASALLLGVATMIAAANFGYGNTLSAQENNARALTAELEVASQQLAKFALMAVHGDEEGFDALAQVKGRVDTIVQALRRGSASPNVRAYENNAMELGTSSALKELTDTWTSMAGDADRILREREQVLSVAEAGDRFRIRVPQISAQLADVVRGMSDAGAAASQISLANRQIVLVDRMSLRVTEALGGGDLAVTAADALQRDAVVFGQVLQAMRDGGEDVGVAQVTDPKAAAALENVASAFADAQKDLDTILAGATDLLEVQQSAQAIAEDSDVLLEDAQALYGKFGAVTGRLFPNDLLTPMAGMVAALALVGVLTAAYRIERNAMRGP